MFKTNPPERQTDGELIVGFQKGNAAAFDVFLGRYKDPADVQVPAALAGDSVQIDTASGGVNDVNTSKKP